jgi:hypothetical protein
MDGAKADCASVFSSSATAEIDAMYSIYGRVVVVHHYTLIKVKLQAGQVCIISPTTLICCSELGNKLIHNVYVTIHALNTY